MFGIGSLGIFGMSPKMQKEQQDRHEAMMERRRAAMVPWTKNLPWAKQLNIVASTWPAWSLFNVEPTLHNNVNHERDTAGKFVVSPGGTYLYCEKRLLLGARLQTMQGSRRGMEHRKQTNLL